MKLIKFVPLVLTFILTGCGATKDLHNDKLYQTKPNTESLLSILLQPNQRFTYKEVSHLIDARSEGNYTISGNQLVLNSDKKYFQGIVNSYESIVLSDSLEINILEHDQIPLSKATVTVNNSNHLTGLTDESGKLIIGKQVVESIQLHMLGYIYNYQVQNPNANVFNLEIKLNNLTDVFFENETLLLKKNKFIDPEGRIFYLK